MEDVIYTMHKLQAQTQDSRLTPSLHTPDSFCEHISNCTYKFTTPKPKENTSRPLDTRKAENSAIFLEFLTSTYDKRQTTAKLRMQLPSAIPTDDI